MTRATTAALIPLCAAATWLPAAQAQAAMVELTVTRTDTMIGLSRQMLATPQAWREVATLNKLRTRTASTPATCCAFRSA